MIFYRTKPSTEGCGMIYCIEENSGDKRLTAFFNHPFIDDPGTITEDSDDQHHDHDLQQDVVLFNGFNVDVICY